MSTPARHLTRNARESCVMARVQRVGSRFYRCFALRHHGSWEAAEAAARLWLRPVLAGLPPAGRRESRPGPRNRSGVVGVFFRDGFRVLKSGRPAAYPGYVTRWPGARVGVKWMFSTCGGEEGAFLHACLSRELRSADRLRIAWAVRALTPERRKDLLASRRPREECAGGQDHPGVGSDDGPTAIAVFGDACFRRGIGIRSSATPAELVPEAGIEPATKGL